MTEVHEVIRLFEVAHGREATNLAEVLEWWFDPKRVADATP